MINISGIHDFKYWYDAYCTKVYDGDTIHVNVDKGFSDWRIKMIIRLHRINTPEIRGEERSLGLVAKARVEELILDKKIIIKTFKDKTGKYGRYLAEIFYQNFKLEWVNLNDQLVIEELAVYAEY